MRHGAMSRRQLTLALVMGVAAMLLAVWEHCDEARLARRQAALRESVERTRREVEFARLRLAEAQARSAVEVESVESLGLTRPAVDHVVVLAVPRAAVPTVRPADGSVAAVGRRFLDALLPAAGARVTRPDTD